jgi:histidinol-phosphate aminotransferase
MTVLNLNRNESALPPPAHVVDAVRSLDPDAFRTYPVELQQTFTQSLAERLATTPDRIVIANGADELLVALARAFVAPGDNLLTVTPTFEMYGRAADMVGAEWRTVSYERRWEFDPHALLRRADENTTLVILGHPNNPTGEALAVDDLRLISGALPHATIAVDEVYLALSPWSLVNAAELLPNVVTIGSLSKIAALAGMRVGYALAEPQRAEALRRVIPPYPVSTHALVAANAYMTGGSLTDAFNVALQAQVARSLDAIVYGIGPFANAYWRGLANFVLMDFGERGPRIADGLAQRGLAVRTFDAAELAGAIRFSAGDDKATDILLESVRFVLRGAYA